MGTWVETPAVIDQVELKFNRGRRGSTTAKVVASYSYQYDGRDFTGKRVSIFDLYDNFGSFQRDTYQKLKQHVQIQKPFRCFVNPTQTAEAVLHRDLRWEWVSFCTIFAIAFSWFGGAKLQAIWRSRPRQRAASTLD
jgi:hypothetical protein